MIRYYTSGVRHSGVRDAAESQSGTGCLLAAELLVPHCMVFADVVATKGPLAGTCTREPRRTSVLRIRASSSYHLVII